MKSICNKKIILFISFILFIADYFNLFNLLGLHINRINFDFWNLFIVVVLYIITYIAIDKRDNLRKDNQEKIAKILLKDSYNLCNEYTNILDSELFKSKVPENFPGNDTVCDNPVYLNIKNAPFIHEDILMDFATDGVIAENDLQNYLNLKYAYQKFFTMVVVFYDIDHITNPIKKEVLHYAKVNLKQ